MQNSCSYKTIRNTKQRKSSQLTLTRLSSNSTSSIRCGLLRIVVEQIHNKSITNRNKWSFDLYSFLWCLKLSSSPSILGHFCRPWPPCTLAPICSCLSCLIVAKPLIATVTSTDSRFPSELQRNTSIGFGAGRQKDRALDFFWLAAAYCMKSN